MTAATQLQWIPRVRHTMADVERAEAIVIRRVKDLHGEQHEPGAVWVREAALSLLADEASNPTKEGAE